MLFLLVHLLSYSILTVVSLPLLLAGCCKCRKRHVYFETDFPVFNSPKNLYNLWKENDDPAADGLVPLKAKVVMVEEKPKIHIMTRKIVWEPPDWNPPKGRYNRDPLAPGPVVFDSKGKPTFVVNGPLDVAGCTDITVKDQHLVMVYENANTKELALFVGFLASALRTTFVRYFAFETARRSDFGVFSGIDGRAVGLTLAKIDQQPIFFYTVEKRGMWLEQFLCCEPKLDPDQVATICLKMLDLIDALNMPHGNLSPAAFQIDLETLDLEMVFMGLMRRKGFSEYFNRPDLYFDPIFCSRAVHRYHVWTKRDDYESVYFMFLELITHNPLFWRYAEQPYDSGFYPKILQSKQSFFQSGIEFQRLTRGLPEALIGLMTVLNDTIEDTSIMYKEFRHRNREFYRRVSTFQPFWDDAGKNEMSTPFKAKRAKQRKRLQYFEVPNFAEATDWDEDENYEKTLATVDCTEDNSESKKSKKEEETNLSSLKQCPR